MMINETASATVLNLSFPAKISGPNANSGSENTSETSASGKSPETGGQDLPVQGKRQPQMVQGFVEIREAIDEINEFVQTIQRDLSFNIDEASGQTVIRVIDRESGVLIRQIPSEEVLAFAGQIRDAREIAMDQREAPTGLLFSEST